jgi:hypothetical protein
MGILREYINSIVDCMSPISRSLIGIVALIGAIGFLLTALDPSGLPATSLVFHGMAALFILIAVACFFPRSHPLTLRVIGAAIFFAYGSYLVSSFDTPNFSRALRGFAIWGMPSGYLMVVGNYPIWGKGAAGINSTDASQSRKIR